MVEGAVDGAEESAKILFTLRIGEGIAELVEASIHPLVVAGHQVAVFGGDHGDAVTSLSFIP